MKKKLQKLFLTSLLLFSFVFAYPNTSDAALCYKMASYEPGGGEFNTPLFNMNILNGDCFTIATKNDIGSTNYRNGLQFLFDLMVGASIALAVILFTFGAAQGIIQDVAGQKISVFAEKEAKDRMRNAIVGLLIVLGAWLVINTINPDLLRLPELQSVYNLPTSSSLPAGAVAR